MATTARWLGVSRASSSSAAQERQREVDQVRLALPVLAGLKDQHLDRLALIGRQHAPLARAFEDIFFDLELSHEGWDTRRRAGFARCWGMCEEGCRRACR